MGELSQQADRTIIYTMLSRQIHYITLATIFVGISCLGICDTPAEPLVSGNAKSIRERTLQSVNASEQNLHPTKVLEPLQTQISQRDMKIIEQLVAIAQGNSAQVRETKAGMGLNAFTDVVTIEILPSLTNRKYISSSPSSENENSLSATITIDPIKLINTFTQQPIVVARWQEAKKQKRVAVVQYYLAYLQARQATQIATHKMKKFTHATVTSIPARTSTEANIHQIDNSDYVTAATEMLGANTRERVALEELAACVGLSPEQAIAIVNER